LNTSGIGFDLPGKKSQLLKLEEKMSTAGFWDNQDTAQSVISQMSCLRAVLEPAEEVCRGVKDLAELFELAEGEADRNLLMQLEKDFVGLKKQCEHVELQGLLSRPEDTRNCFFGIHAGAGGTESCDWANMLLRMYTRYFESKKYKYEELDITPGEEAGIRSVTLHVSGPFVFGKLSCETEIGRASCRERV
jgi:peptide chain release factor 2